MLKVLQLLEEIITHAVAEMVQYIITELYVKKWFYNTSTVENFVSKQTLYLCKICSLLASLWTLYRRWCLILFIVGGIGQVWIIQLGNLPNSLLIFPLFLHFMYRQKSSGFPGVPNYWILDLGTFTVLCSTVNFTKIVFWNRLMYSISDSFHLPSYKIH